MRALRSGLLFVAIGPSLHSTIHLSHPSSQYLQHLSLSHTSPPASPSALGEREHILGVTSGAVSEVDSIGTEAITGASMWGIRRQAEDVGRFLEGALQGFVLSTVER